MSATFDNDNVSAYRIFVEYFSARYPCFSGRVRSSKNGCAWAVRGSSKAFAAFFLAIFVFISMLLLAHATGLHYDPIAIVPLALLAFACTILALWMTQIVETDVVSLGDGRGVSIRWRWAGFVVKQKFVSGNPEFVITYCMVSHRHPVQSTWYGYALVCVVEKTIVCGCVCTANSVDIIEEYIRVFCVDSGLCVTGSLSGTLTVKQ